MLAFTGLRTLTGLHTSQTLLGLVLGGIVSDFSSWVTDHHYHFQPCFRRPKINISGEIAMTLTCISLPTGRSHLGHNISCYNCKGYESQCTKATLKANHHKYLKDCHGVGDRCMRIWQKINDRWDLCKACAQMNDCAMKWRRCAMKKRLQRTPTIVPSPAATMTLATRLTLAWTLVYIWCSSVLLLVWLKPLISLDFTTPRRADDRTKKTFERDLLRKTAWQELTPSEVLMIGSKVKLMRGKREFSSEVISVCESWHQLPFRQGVTTI